MKPPLDDNTSSSFLCQLLQVLARTEHECMVPNLTETESFVLDVGAKKHTIAGPVIVYGVSASVVYGLVYWISTML